MYVGQLITSSIAEHHCKQCTTTQRVKHMDHHHHHVNCFAHSVAKPIVEKLIAIQSNTPIYVTQSSVPFNDKWLPIEYHYTYPLVMPCYLEIERRHRLYLCDVNATLSARNASRASVNQHIQIICAYVGGNEREGERERRHICKHRSEGNLYIYYMPSTSLKIDDARCICAGAENATWKSKV